MSNELLHLSCSWNDASRVLLKATGISLEEFDGWVSDIQRFLDGELSRSAETMLTLADKEIILVSIKGLKGNRPYFIFDGKGLQKALFKDTWEEIEMFAPSTALELVHEISVKRQKCTTIHCGHCSQISGWLMEQIERIARENVKPKR